MTRWRTERPPTPWAGGCSSLIPARRSAVGASAWCLHDALGAAGLLVGPQHGVLTSFVHSAFGIPEAVGGPYPQYPTRYRGLGWPGTEGSRPRASTTCGGGGMIRGRGGGSATMCC
jgi:hypothetical protein